MKLVGTADELESRVDLTVTVCGHPGELDTSSRQGRVVTPIGAGDDYAHALAVDSDGKILLAGGSSEHRGRMALLRLERDGTLDASFGDGSRHLPGSTALLDEQFQNPFFLARHAYARLGRRKLRTQTFFCPYSRQ